MNAHAWEALTSLFPRPPHYTVNWEALLHSPLAPHLERMRATPQNPRWHGEGDVLTHTEMAVEALLRDPDYRARSERERDILFLALLLHDIGKTICTVTENGVPTSPKHTVIGAKMARELLMGELALGGTPERISFRETVCTLIRRHGMPLHLREQAEPERALITLAAAARLAPDFSLSLLRILVRADIAGRIAPDTESLLEENELTFLLAEELGICDAPYPFPDPVTEHAYLTGRGTARDFPLFDETWREAVLLSGLPGAGKDTWIREHLPEHFVISLDDIRREMRISPTDSDGQGRVAARAKELARECLRAHRPLVWNATNVTPQTRLRQLSLFEKYGAFTRIVYLEPPLQTILAQNAGRREEVPGRIIRDLLAKTEPPAKEEAHEVLWLSPNDTENK